MKVNYHKNTRAFILFWNMTAGDVGFLSKLFQMPIDKLKRKATNLRFKGVTLCQPRITDISVIDDNTKIPLRVSFIRELIVDRL